jgi:hypothetical protein
MHNDNCLTYNILRFAYRVKNSRELIAPGEFLTPYFMITNLTDILVWNHEDGDVQLRYIHFSWIPGDFVIPAW